MKKYFNTTGVCVENLHYMVDINDKIDKIVDLIEKNKYFVINRPRQFGKTTTLSKLQMRLQKDYVVIRISFEGIGDKAFSDEELMSKAIIKLFSKSLRKNNKELSRKLQQMVENVSNFMDLDEVISDFIYESEKEVVLIIDEVDKSSNNQLFLSFLGMLRSRYLNMIEGFEDSFKSVILAGVHDIKNLKLKIRNDEGIKYNSPWNIAVDFNIDMSFNCSEIGTMISDYNKDNGLNINVDEISKEIYFFTSGYPFLVSRICQIIDERFYPDEKESWNIKDIQKSVKIITLENNTLFESVIKNIENNKELYLLVRRILINGESIVFNRLDPIIDLGITYGIFSDSDNVLKISNKIFEEILYNYMISKLSTKVQDMSLYNFKNSFITEEGGLDIEEVLRKFQQYMKENYSSLDSKFIEIEGRLIFMAFLTPIVNGVGFTFKEVQISEEKRLDIVVIYNNFKYIIELKIFRGKKYHEQGINQLVDYLDINSLEKGYLVVFNFNKDKEYKEEKIPVDKKEIFTVFV